jgi:predicted ATPase
MENRLVPTIVGLRAVGTPVAADALDGAKKLFETLRVLYVKKPNQSWSVEALAQQAGMSPKTVGRLLLHIAIPNSVFDSCAWDDSGRITIFSIASRILHEDPFEAVIEESPADAPIRLTVRDFMGLEQVDFSPEGVCLIVGPNGSGKSTLLQAFVFLRDLFQSGVEGAVKLQRGVSGLKRLGAGQKAEVVLGFGVGDVSWEIRLPIDERSMSPFPGEIVSSGSNNLVRRRSDQQDWFLGRERRTSTGSDDRTCLREAWDLQSPRILQSLVRTLRSYRLYGSYALDVLRNGGIGGDWDRTLVPNGQNLFVVLRNWKTAPRESRNQFEWVLKHLRRAFKGIIDDIEFSAPLGQIVPAKFFPAGSKTGLHISRAAEGLLVGLLHLTAVAGAEDGAILAIEEMENFLHPHAIRSIVASMRELAEERHLTILLTTHSPLLMNVFRSHPENVFVMEPGRPSLPVPLTELHDPDWLAHFEIGDLYDRMEFGAPAKVEGS